MKTYSLSFDQGVCYSNLPLDSDKKVIYFFYKTVKSSDGKSIYLNKLLYIGKSTDASTRLTNRHEKIEPALKMVDEKKGEGLYISYAILDSDSFKTDDDIFRAEACLIINLKPTLNDSATSAFHWNETCVSVNGKLAMSSEKKTFTAKE